MDIKPANHLSRALELDSSRGAASEKTDDALSTVGASGTTTADRVSISSGAHEQLGFAEKDPSVAENSLQRKVNSSEEIKRESPARRADLSYSQVRQNADRIGLDASSRSKDRVSAEETADAQRMAMDEVALEEERTRLQAKDEAVAQALLTYLRATSETREILENSEAEQSARELEQFEVGDARAVEGQPDFSTKLGPGGEEVFEVGTYSTKVVPSTEDAQETLRSLEERRRLGLAPDSFFVSEPRAELKETIAQSKAQEHVLESRRVEHGNDIGIAADASAAVVQALRQQIHIGSTANTTESESTQSVEDSGVSDSGIATEETPLNPLLDGLRSYQKAVESMEESEATKLLPDVLV